MASIREGELLWQPSEHFKAQSRLADYMRWLAANHGLQFETYDDLWRWSAGEIERFWVTIYEYFDIHLPRHFRKVLSRRAMPGAHWFEGAEINYAEQVFRHATDQWPAIVFRSETRPAEEISWAQLRHETAHVATALRSAGINPGDRVVAYMPNIPQTISAFLGAASVGAVWSSCSPDFGLNAVIDRFAQIEPRVLFAVDGYRYGGKAFDRREVVRDLLAALPTVERVVLIPYLDEAAELDGALRWPEMLSQRARDLTFEPVPFEHPLWILYSSGTTGLPKGLVHGHGGVVLEHTKVLALHQDINPGDRLFWFTSTGWMMWNYVVSALLVGATPAIHDGNPGYPDLDVLWQYAEDARLTVFGTSAAYVTACMKAGLEPGNRHDLSALRNLSSTGSPLPVEGFAWVYEDVKPDLWLTSVSGGTDVVSAFVVGNPLLPVYAGELQCRALGVNIQSFDERGRPGLNRQGELVITEPMPSMPLYFWNDPDGSRYREAYFDMYPGVWRHGDWIRINERGGSVIEGRSDSTLNRLGVRLGSSEMYAVVEGFAEVADSLVVGIEQPGGGYYMPLFVVLATGCTLDANLTARINEALRDTLSPRHVPDEIVAVPGIPRTLSGKKMEVPVKKLFMGVPLEKAANPGATTDPQVLRYFEELARARSTDAVRS